MGCDYAQRARLGWDNRIVVLAMILQSSMAGVKRRLESWRKIAQAFRKLKLTVVHINEHESNYCEDFVSAVHFRGIIA
jgi:hypothetical protein